MNEIFTRHRPKVLVLRCNTLYYTSLGGEDTTLWQNRFDRFYCFSVHTPCNTDSKLLSDEIRSLPWSSDERILAAASSSKFSYFKIKFFYLHYARLHPHLMPFWLLPKHSGKHRDKEMISVGHYTHHLVTKGETTWSSQFSVALCSYLTMAGRSNHSQPQLYKR